MSYQFDTDSVRSATMRKIRRKNTRPEVLLRRALWHQGVRYRVDYGKAPGRPDIAVVGRRIAVFVDGSFWHGYDWENKRLRIASNRQYWIPKIERTIERDRAVNAALSALGWRVLRFWDFQVHKDLDSCLAAVLEAIVDGERD